VSVGVVDGGAVTEVLDGLAGALGASEEDGIRALRGAKGELVEGDALTAGLDDSSSSSLGEADGGDGKSRHLQETWVVCYRTNNNCSLILLTLHESCQTRERNRGIVDSGHSQSLHDSGGEFRVGSSFKEAVML
jgi:hypothetical protein